MFRLKKVLNHACIQHYTIINLRAAGVIILCGLFFCKVPPGIFKEVCADKFFWREFEIVINRSDGMGCILP